MAVEKKGKYITCFPPSISRWYNFQSQVQLCPEKQNKFNRCSRFWISSAIFTVLFLPNSLHITTVLNFSANITIFHAEAHCCDFSAPNIWKVIRQSNMQAAHLLLAEVSAMMALHCGAVHLFPHRTPDEAEAAEQNQTHISSYGFALGKH